MVELVLHHVNLDIIEVKDNLEIVNLTCDSGYFFNSPEGYFQRACTTTSCIPPFSDNEESPPNSPLKGNCDFCDSSGYFLNKPYAQWWNLCYIM